MGGEWTVTGPGGGAAARPSAWVEDSAGGRHDFDGRGFVGAADHCRRYSLTLHGPRDHGRRIKAVHIAADAALRVTEISWWSGEWRAWAP